MTKEAEQLKEWAEHPGKMVRDLFGAVPDPWQDEGLEIFPHCQRMAMKAARGPGKTTFLAWLAWNFLLTRWCPKVLGTSISGDNLRDGLWAEMAKWREKSALLKAAFEYQKTRIFARSHPDTWFMSARNWSQSASPEQQANTLAGLHEDRILFLVDEVGDIPDAVMVQTDNALSSCIEGHIVIAGNPTRLEGQLYRACTSEKDLWKVIDITGDPDDPNRSPRISVEWARQQIRKWGIDSPWVQVNVFGRFPSASLTALIGPDDIEAAMNRVWTPRDIGIAPRIIGVDVAREGDDSSCVFRRHGLQAFQPEIRRDLRSVEGAGWVARVWDDFRADACFIDDTGGFGAGWIDQLAQLGKTPIGVGFARAAHNRERYENKRAEMYLDAIQWIKRGGALPRNERLKAALIATTYTHKKGRLLIEPKEIVKAKLRYSPDETDAFVVGFAEPVSPKTGTGTRKVVRLPDYDPFAEKQARKQDYDPFRYS